MTTTRKGNFPERNKFFQTNIAEMRCALRGSVSTCNYSSNCAIVSLDLYVRIKPFFFILLLTLTRKSVFLIRVGYTAKYYKLLRSNNN